MRTLHFDAAGNLLAPPSLPPFSVPAGTASTLDVDEVRYPALLQDLIAFWPQYTRVGNALHKNGVPIAENVDPTAQALYATQQLRAAAAVLLTDAKAEMKAMRGLLLLARKEINFLRARLRDQDAAVAGAASLAALKSAWATVAADSPMPDRTVAQIKSAWPVEIDTADADT